MAEETPTPVPVQVVKQPGPLPAIVQPWVDLIHTIGLPWAMIACLMYFGYPIAKSSLDTLNRMEDLANKAMPLLDKASEAVPLLEQLNRTNLASARQRHNDITELKASIPQKVPDDE